MTDLHFLRKFHIFASGNCPFSTLKNRRYSMGRILLAGFLGAIVLMIWGFLSWAVLPWSGQSMLMLQNEDAVLSALKAGNAESGMYVIPGMKDHNDEAAKKAHMEKMKAGPIAMIQYS